MAADRYEGPSFKLYDVQCVSWFDSSGVFSARTEAGGEDKNVTVFSGSTLQDAKDKLGKAILARRKRFDVPFTIVGNDGTIRNGSITGLHAGNGNMLVAFEDGEKGQFTQGYSQTVFPRLSRHDAQHVAMVRKAEMQAAATARTEVKRLQGQWDLAKAVKAEIERG